MTIIMRIRIKYIIDLLYYSTYLFRISIKVDISIIKKGHAYCVTYWRFY
jgi:hypothetical protein